MNSESKLSSVGIIGDSPFGQTPSLHSLRHQRIGIEVCFASCCADFGNRVFAAFGIATDDHVLLTKLVVILPPVLISRTNIYIPDLGQKTVCGDKIYSEWEWIYG